MYMREQLEYQTRLKISQASLSDGGTTLILVIENQGESRLTSFDDWDIIVQYDDGRSTPMRHQGYMHYTSAIPTQNEWTVDGLYLSDVIPTFTPEVFEHDIFNPGEAVRLVVHLEQSVGEGESLQVVIGLPTGGLLSTMLTRNILPVLDTNAGLAMPSATTAIIDGSLLHTTDRDHPAEDLTYTILTSPTQGVLSLPRTFTQAQVDAGLLTYTHMGAGNDSFQFSVTDGVDVIGIYTFVIAVA